MAKVKKKKRLLKLVLLLTLKIVINILKIVQTIEPPLCILGFD